METPPPDGPIDLRALQEDKSLAGAIPLDSPVAQALREFTGQVLTANCVALVTVAMTAQGQVMVARVSPGGIVQIMGMMALAKHLLLSGSGQPVQQ